MRLVQFLLSGMLQLWPLVQSNQIGGQEQGRSKTVSSSGSSGKGANELVR